ncbi:unnamed protein product [Mytilus coruscus]|uniref:Uncharacterized protein n=1 Tax=Mytilus coruscus TaxID=42192 RepID=A0A6J8F0Y4_MYTCO|nr:unnamed protein product [Mytilus coruscus]
MLSLVSVVNICTDDTKQQDNSESVLVNANTMRNCTCELSVINQDKAITVYMQRFGQKTSSSPLDYGCGLLLRFGKGSNARFWEAQCVVGNSIIFDSIPINDTITITSITVNGTLNDDEGYCIEIKKDIDDTITIAVGTSVGGFVIIIVVIVMVCIYRRNHPKSTSKPCPAVKTDSDDYGLRDNVLYASSQLPDTTQTQNNVDSPITNKISLEINSNYSTEDLDKIPSVEESTGDYSSIDLEKLASSKSNMNGSSNEKPIIAPKPKQKMTIQDDDYSVPDKKKMTYVTAPGEHGCEYAVVTKPNKSNFDKSENQSSTSNVYAVVEKKKRMSDGKGTNQKRDSLKAEND